MSQILSDINIAREAVFAVEKRNKEILELEESINELHKILGYVYEHIQIQVFIIIAVYNLILEIE